MAEYLRFRCPLCGMMPLADQVDFEQPYPIKIYLQRIGGSESLQDPLAPRIIEERKRRGRPRRKPKIRGLISYQEIENAELEEKIKKKIKIFTDHLK